MELYAPESVGMDSERLARIDTAMADFLKDNRLPGVMTLVQRRGKVVHLGKYGLMDIAAGKPMREDGIFRIYSMTKPIVSVALMTLYEEGRLSLNDPVAKYIPAFKDTKVYAGMGPTGMKLVDQSPVMTVYHLLTHTSGLSYGWFFDTPVEDLYRQTFPERYQRTDVLADIIDQLAALPLLFQPGTQWRYSFATDVVGHLIQVIADMPLGDFLAERIFKPLGMVDTGFMVPAEKCHRIAPIYASKALYDPFELELKDVPLLRDVTTSTTCPSGGGGLLSTLADYLAFANCVLNMGKYQGGRLLGRKTIEWMTTNHMPPALMPITMGENVIDHGFGLGFGVVETLGASRSVTSVGKYGWGGAANTDYWADPSEALIGLMMTQYMPMEPYPVQERFRNLAYQAIVD